MTTFIEMCGFYLKGYPNIQLSDKLTKEQILMTSNVTFPKSTEINCSEMQH